MPLYGNIEYIFAFCIVYVQYISSYINLYADIYIYNCYIYLLTKVTALNINK